MPLHPQSKRFIEMTQAQNRPPWEDLPVAESRDLFQSFESAFGIGPKLHAVDDMLIADVPVRVYRPNDGSNLPCVVYFHGGGWVIGNLETHDTLCRRLCAACDCIVIAVDYRLAPEHKHPAAVEDCYAVTQLVAKNAEQFGVNANQLALVGDSAGGNLAAAVALRARDDDSEFTIRLQVLIYPVVEADFGTSSYRDFSKDHGLTAATMRWMWEQYVGEDPVGDQRYVVLTQNDLSGLPPTHVVTAEYDVLRDEGEAFADKLAAAGVPVTRKRYDGMLHGFVHFSALFDDGIQAISEIGTKIRYALTDA